MTDSSAMRVRLRDVADAEALRDEVLERGRGLELTGWVRADRDPGARAGRRGEISVHAEGEPAALQALVGFLRESGVPVEAATLRVEGHEQFAARGVSAGEFVVQEHQATAHHFDLRLEVEGVMRSWAVPRGPSLDPAAKRLAVEVEDHAMSHNDFEGALGRGGVIVWDRGSYEQGGRVPWPEALERGHAVFVLHGEKLRGGFALQRTRTSSPAQWLLVKRRDDQARPGGDIVTEAPRSVLTGRTLHEVVSGAAGAAAR